MADGKKLEQAVKNMMKIGKHLSFVGENVTLNSPTLRMRIPLSYSKVSMIKDKWRFKSQEEEKQHLCDSSES